jgi:hypothetical protein
MSDATAIIQNQQETKARRLRGTSHVVASPGLYQVSNVFNHAYWQLQFCIDAEEAKELKKQETERRREERRRGEEEKKILRERERAAKQRQREEAKQRKEREKQERVASKNASQTVAYHNSGRLSCIRDCLHCSANDHLFF